MSYKGQILIINNLVASALWHHLACIDPPFDVLSTIQSILIDFFWDTLIDFFLTLGAEKHVVPIKGRRRFGSNAFAEQNGYFSSPVYTKTFNVPCRDKLGGCCLCNSSKHRRPRFGQSFVWLDPQRLKLCDCPVFYRNLFQVWSLFSTTKESSALSLFWLLQEPLVLGSRLDLSHGMSFAISESSLRNVKVTTIGQLLEIAGPGFNNVTATAERLGLKSCRIVAKALEYWRLALTEEEKVLLAQCSQGFANPDYKDPFSGFEYFSSYGGMSWYAFSL